VEETKGLAQQEGRGFLYRGHSRTWGKLAIFTKAEDTTPYAPPVSGYFAGTAGRWHVESYHDKVGQQEEKRVLV